MATAFEIIQEELQELNPDALLLNGFEDALIGISERCGQDSVALYDYEICVKILRDRDGMTDEDAREFIEFNVVTAWLGDGTPSFAHLREIKE